LLIKEHEPIRRAISVLEAMASDAENGRRINRNDVNALFIFLHYFAHGWHQAKEEPYCFYSEAVGDIQSCGRCYTRAIAGSFTEHTEGRSLVEQAQLALFSERRSEFVESARKTRRLERGVLTRRHYEVTSDRD
jgi:hemerythrin-like domain-containing protein